MADRYRYWAFISYSHADEAWAKWLHRALETYRVPTRLVGTPGPFGPRPKRLFPIFRDRDELSSSAELGSVIEAALRESRHQIVICSPSSTRSQWVDAEIRRFKSLGRENRVLAFIVDGEPHAADPARECFPIALRRKVDRKAGITDEPSEPIAADARPFADHKHGARLKLIAGLLGVGYDELRQRERQRRFWLRVQQAAIVVAAVALLAGLTSWSQQREARVVAEARLDRLIHLGRQELREQRHARAAVYLAEAFRGGRDTLPLRYWLARAMQPVDAVDRGITALDAPVVDAVLTPDGQRLLSVAERYARVHDISSGALIHETPIPLAGFMGSPRITADGRHAVISGGDSSEGLADSMKSLVLDLQTGALLATVPGMMWPAFGHVVSPDGRKLLLGIQPPPNSAAKPHIRVHELPSGRLLARLESDEGTAAATFSPDGRRIVTAGEGRGEIRIWDAASYKLIRTIQPRQAIAHSAYWTGRGSELLSISEAGAIKLWDGDSGELLDALGSHSLFAMPAAAARQRYWITSSIDGSRLWDLDKGQAVFTTDQFGGLPPAEIELDEQGTHVLAKETETGSLWSVADRQREHFIDVHPGSVVAHFFVDSGQTILSIAGNGDVRRLDAAALRWPSARLEHGDYVNPMERPGVEAVLRATDRGLWISGGADGSVRLWREGDGATLGGSRLHDAAVTELAQANGLLISGDTNGRIAAWDGRKPDAVWTLETDSGISGLRPAADGKRLLVLGKDHRVRELDARTGAVLATMETPDRTVGALALDNGVALLIGRRGSLSRAELSSAHIRPLTEDEGVDVSTDVSPTRAGMLVQSDGRLLRTIDIASAQVQDRIDVADSLGRPLYLRTLASRADGGLVAAGTTEGPIVLWRPGEPGVRLLEGHGEQVRTIAHDPTGRLLASASVGGEVIVWDLEGGQPLQRIRTSSEPATILAFSGDGTRLLSNERLSNALRLWDVSLEQRALPQIDRRIRCAVPWGLESFNLVHRSPQAADCAGAQAGSTAALR